jgi:hypothetical protein
MKMSRRNRSLHMHAKTRQHWRVVKGGKTLAEVSAQSAVHANQVAQGKSELIGCDQRREASGGRRWSAACQGRLGRVGGGTWRPMRAWWKPARSWAVYLEMFQNPASARCSWRANPRYDLFQETIHTEPPLLSFLGGII